MVRIIWVTSFYDYPLSGLCDIDGDLYQFEYEDESKAYHLFKLGRISKIRWHFRKALFELAIGNAWSYPHYQKGTGTYRKFRKFPGNLFFFLYYLPLKWRVKRLKAKTDKKEIEKRPPDYILSFKDLA